MTFLVFRARGVADCHQLLDGVADRLAGDTLEEFLPSVLEVQRDWWASLGRGTWDGHDLERSGRLRAAMTEEGAAGQRVDVSGDELVFGFADDGPGDPGLYGRVLAARGLEPIADPADADAEELAEDYALALVNRG